MFVCVCVTYVFENLNTHVRMFALCACVRLGVIVRV